MRRLFLLALLAAAAPSGAEPSCRLESLPRLAPLVLIGETHCDAGSHAVKAALAALAGEGRLYAGFEAARRTVVYAGGTGDVFPDYAPGAASRAFAFGVDAPLPHGLAGSYLFARGGSSGGACERDFRLAAMTGFSWALGRNPYWRAAWEEASRGRLSPEEAGLAARLAAAARGAAPDLDAARDHEVFVGLMLRVNAAYAALVNRDHLAESGRGRPFVSYAPDSRYVDYAREGAWEAFLRREPNGRAYEDEGFALLTWRDREMAGRVADAYCRAAREGLPVAVSLGAAHVPGVRRHLQAWSSRVPVESWESFDERGGEPEPDPSRPPPGRRGSRVVLSRLEEIAL